jgi:hypothetical protein
MSEALDFSKPFWLSAYPNEGTLDYFGFRFYRQPLRSFLVRGAAANDFKNAKTLIFFGAITYAYKELNNLHEDEELSEEQISEWKSWFQMANYLYVVGCFSIHDKIPDRGFTGANEEAKKFFKTFLESSDSEYPLNDVKERFYPKQREWGYLSQFWRPPLSYFRSVLDITNCYYGEYAKECYVLLSKYPGWAKLIDMCKSGIISKQGFEEIKDVIECYSLTEEEKGLAKKIIFDEEKINESENLEYQKSYNFIHNFLTKEYEGYQCKDKNDIAMVLSYAHLRDQPLSEIDTQWKILVSSLMFEIGICRFFTLISDGVVGTTVNKSKIIEILESKISESDLVDVDDSLSTVVDKWKAKHLSSIDSFKALFDELLDYENLDSFLDGVIAGYIVSSISSDKENAKVYDVLTDNYHFFTPQAFFRTHKFSGDIKFSEFINTALFYLLDDQYSFSLDRMNYGQKAKFILIKSEFGDEYIYQVDGRRFYENRGIVEMIEACLRLWESAGI